MLKQRRALLKASALIAASSVLPSRTYSADEAKGSGLDGPTHLVHVSMIDYFADKGYRMAGSLPTITGDESFNAGLRYDETGVDVLPGQMIIQPCVRVEDIARKHRRDVLPLFHIFCCFAPPDHSKMDTFKQLMAYLDVNDGLKKSHLQFVSTSEFEPFLPILAEHGIDTDRQVFFRDTKEAQVAADGSGFYRFPGDPSAHAFATVGIYYWIDEGDPPVFSTYPQTAGWSEIGEASTDATVQFAFGLGTERFALATTGQIPDWQDRLGLLFEHIDRFSGGNNPPSGRILFEAN